MSARSNPVESNGLPAPEQNWLGDGVNGKHFRVSFLKSKCELILGLRIATEANDFDEAAREKLAKLNPKWTKGMSKWFAGWTLVPSADGGDCPQGIAVKFEILFGVAEDSDVRLMAHNDDGLSDDSALHLNDLRVSLPSYSVVAHEVGHLFGLEDEYPDSPNHPLEWTPPEDWKKSIMGAPGPWAKLLLRHKEKITANAKIGEMVPDGPFQIRE